MYKHELHRRYYGRPDGREARFPLRPVLLLLTVLMVGIFIGAVSVRRGEAAPSQSIASPETGVQDESPAANLLFVPSDNGSNDLTRSTETPAPVDSAVVSLPSSRLTVSVDGDPIEIELEDYLVGVVAGEMSASSEPAALQAQAVAARTFTVLHMQGRAKCKSGCTVCDDHRCCQAYLTDDELRSAWGDHYEEYLSVITSAVRSTAGLVVTFEGQPISALYHASSGPATESSEEVFAVALPYLVSVDSFEGEAEIVSVQEFPLSEVAAKLNSIYTEANIKIPLADNDFSIWGRNDSGRVQLIQIGDSVITGSAMRAALGLKSAAFTVEHDDTTITFTCQGYGHGVGMSQVGANEMAKDGADFEEILAHFYTGTALARLYYSC